MLTLKNKKVKQLILEICAKKIVPKFLLCGFIKVYEAILDFTISNCAKLVYSNMSNYNMFAPAQWLSGRASAL